MSDFTTPFPAVSGLDATRRSVFISRTYQHLLVAILGFAAVETFFFQMGLAYPMAQAMLGVSWLLVIGGLMVAGWLFSGIAGRSESKAAQYAALVGYVVAEAVFFVPLLVIAEIQAPGAISSAAVATLVGFVGLTLVAMYSGKDFSFLGSSLRWIGVSALVLIVCGVIFGFQLGVYFSVGMVVFAGLAILYETSKVLNTYPEDRYVAASLALFASVALLFWYVLRIFSRR
jgi:hypothetical protein